MNVDRGRLVMVAILVGTLATGAVLAENPIVADVLLLFLYGAWAGIVKLVVSRSRYVGGLAMLLLSLPLMGIAFITDWVALFWALVFAHGSWLAITDAAKLRTW